MELKVNLEFNVAVNDDFKRAANHYLNISTHLLDRFKTEIKTAYIHIAESPENYFVLQKKNKIRRYRLEKFPYSIIYSQQKEDTVYILAIKHDKQKDYWKKRI